MQPLATSTKRIESIDLLRGLVMIIMALDHTRDLFHKDAFTGDPLNPETTTSVLYFTRWITHFCAPSFVFLSGLSAWLQKGRKTTKELSRFLITRGLWLILMEISVINFGILADIQFTNILLQTIWSIGISMVILGMMIWLPFTVIFGIGILIVVGHNAMDFAENARQGNVPLWWTFLHRPALVPLGGGYSLGVFYPFLPWTGLMLLGYCCGKLLTTLEVPRRNRILLWLGIASLAFFVILRAANIYGDPGRWVEQKTGLQTFFSFMNVQKYPPSLLFMSATVGCALVFLSQVKNTRGRLAKIVSVYGRVPFFYYILHFYLLHLISILLYLYRGHSFAEGAKGIPGFPFRFAMPGEGYSLAITYVVWISVVVALYPLCRWYDSYKTHHREKWWLSYL